jgi:hypothetical protein
LLGDEMMVAHLLYQNLHHLHLQQYSYKGFILKLLGRIHKS